MHESSGEPRFYLCMLHTMLETIYIKSNCRDSLSFEAPPAHMKKTSSYRGPHCNYTQHDLSQQRCGANGGALHDELWQK